MDDKAKSPTLKLASKRNKILWRIIRGYLILTWRFG